MSKAHKDLSQGTVRRIKGCLGETRNQSFLKALKTLKQELIGGTHYWAGGHMQDALERGNIKDNKSRCMLLRDLGREW
jgi:hypothetical protein